MTRTCMSCSHRTTSTHRGGKEQHKCSRLGIFVSAANIIGETITCDLYDDARKEPEQPKRRDHLPAFLL